METKIEISKQEYDTLKAKAERLDKIEAEVLKYYEDYDEDGNEIPPEKEGDLSDIGEYICSEFGMLGMG